MTPPVSLIVPLRSGEAHILASVDGLTTFCGQDVRRPCFITTLPIDRDVCRSCLVAESESILARRRS